MCLLQEKKLSNPEVAEHLAALREAESLEPGPEDPSPPIISGERTLSLLEGARTSLPQVCSLFTPDVSTPQSDRLEGGDSSSHQIAGSGTITGLEGKMGRDESEEGDQSDATLQDLEEEGLEAKSPSEEESTSSGKGPRQAPRRGPHPPNLPFLLPPLLLLLLPDRHLLQG